MRLFMGRKLSIFVTALALFSVLLSPFVVRADDTDDVKKGQLCAELLQAVELRQRQVQISDLVAQLKIAKEDLAVAEADLLAERKKIETMKASGSMMGNLRTLLGLSRWNDSKGTAAAQKQMDNDKKANVGIYERKAQLERQIDVAIQDYARKGVVNAADVEWLIDRHDKTVASLESYIKKLLFSVPIAALTVILEAFDLTTTGYSFSSMFVHWWFFNPRLKDIKEKRAQTQKSIQTLIGDGKAKEIRVRILGDDAPDLVLDGASEDMWALNFWDWILDSDVPGQVDYLSAINLVRLIRRLHVIGTNHRDAIYLQTDIKKDRAKLAKKLEGYLCEARRICNVPQPQR